MQEKNRILRVLKKARVPEEKYKALLPIAENVGFLKEKLDEIRANLEGQGAVIEYDNGGGQQGLRENPEMKVYASLWKSYLLGMNRILEALDDAGAGNALGGRAPKTVLELVRSESRENGKEKSEGA